MDKIKALRRPRFEPDSGVEQISRTCGSAVSLPATEQVLPAEGAEAVHLDLLYPSQSLDAFISRRLQPVLFHADLQLPSGFRAALVRTRKRLQSDAQKYPHSARRLGKLSLMLDEHEELCSLARAYYSALLQG